MLHILNGSSTSATLKRSAVSGIYFPFRDALINGPAPRHAKGEAWRRVRAQHLSQSYGVGLADCERDLAEQEETLSSFRAHEEVVLWFEHDLFCLLNLLYLLDWFAQSEPGQTRLSLINIGEFAGRPNFRGLGELNSDELASLFPGRHQVTLEELTLAAKAWGAYRSDDPTRIEALLETDTSAMPFLKTAFKSHLRRFPSTTTGLGRIEDTALNLLKSGRNKFADLFPRFADDEPVYGLGDAQLGLALLALATARTPLLKIEREDGVAEQPTFEAVLGSSLRLTEIGLSVLRGDANFVQLNGIDQWLGGTNLRSPNNVWWWNEASGELVG